MCTIALAWQVLADAPVAIAANRDEALDRASEPPQLLDGDPAVVAPRDAAAGGTWIGVSERGLVAAITNRWTEPPDAVSADDDASADDSGAEHSGADESDAAAADDSDGGPGADDRDRRSRGLLVRDALAADDAAAAVDLVRAAVAEDRYAGFNLLVADAERATYLEWDGEQPAATADGFAADEATAAADESAADELADEATAATGESTAAEPSPDAPALRERELEPGVHAVVNPGLNEVDDRARRLRDDLAIQGTAPGAAAWLDAAATRLRDHEYGVCVHGDGFGTRSSSLLRVDADGRSAYAFADGPPCTADYEQVVLPATFVEESF